MKRFYREVTVGQAEGGWRVLLDGRGIKTAAGQPQLLPAEGLAAALAAEWASQGEEIDAAAFVLRDLADFAIDIAGPQRGATVAALLRYAETDTLCYRAEPDEPLHARQAEVWEPLLKTAEARWDVHFARVSGVIHHAQPAATLHRLAAVLEAQDPFALAALNTLASLAASLVVGLAALEPQADPAALWQAAELEEMWQAELWGQDAEAQARHARRFATFNAAMEFARLARG
jgi:chaperone required for assembly of F1-ATPase